MKKEVKILNFLDRNNNIIDSIKIQNLKLFDILFDGRYEIKILDNLNLKKCKCELTNKVFDCYKIQIIDNFSYKSSFDAYIEFEGYVNSEIIDILDFGKYDIIDNVI